MVHCVAAATASSATDRLREIPFDFWWKAAACIAGLVLLVVLLRKVAKMNKIVLVVIVFLIVSFLGFNWIYERDEPDWATPAVSWLAGFFPTKGKVESRR